MKAGRKKGFSHSKETKSKIGLANRGEWVKYKCDNCKKECEQKLSHYKRSNTHFCDIKCFKKYQTTLPPQKQNAYKGIRKEGESKQIYHKRYARKHPEIISHLKARRYARERNAEGSHTLGEWNFLKLSFNNRCAICKENRPLTKDHIKPLSLGGTDYIENIQPLCRSCNSKKWNHYYESPELINN